MSKEHVIEALSAYIDGEAKDAARIARHLQHCESCARHHLQLLKLSAHLQALPQAEVRPEFLTRVLAHAADAAPRPRGFRWQWAFPALAAAAMLLLTAGWAWRVAAPKEVETTTPRLAINTQWNSDEAVVDALARMIETGADTSLIDEAPESAEEPLPELSVDDVIDVLAYASWEESEGEGLGDSGDVFSELDTLDSEELEALRAELYDYFSEYSSSDQNQG